MTHLTAEQLDIREDEHRWLAAAIPFLADMKPNTPKETAAGPFTFDMGDIQRFDSCGTAGCILGTAHFLARIEGVSLWGDDVYPEQDEHSDALHDLFFPPDTAYEHVTPALASAAIESFLTTGKPDFVAAGVADRSKWGGSW